MKKIRSATQTLKSIKKVAIPFFQGDKKARAWTFLGLLLLLLIFVSTINVAQSFIGRDFINALSEKDATSFYTLTLWYVCALATASIVASFYRYIEERLALLWREWMTSTMIHKYLSGRNYYKLLTIPDLDNPDQRIGEDVKNFTAVSLSIFLIFLNSFITLISFVGVLASISSHLVWALIIYATVGTFITFKIGHRLVRIYNRQYSREATLRYGLVRIRDNAESIAFYRGERKEGLDIAKRFRAILRNTRFLITWNRNLGFFTTGYNNMALIVPTLVIAPLFLAGEVQFGVVTQAGGAFAQVLGATSIIITQFERLSAYMASVTRLETLWSELHAPIASEESTISVEEGDRLKLDKVTIRPPKTDRDLVRELSLHLKVGKGMLIMGPSGSGKSSILRTVAGLWNVGTGTMQRPGSRDMMFLPQKPYLFIGSLRSQLLYPYGERSDNDVQLAKVLAKVNLDEVFNRVEKNLNTVIDWPNILSLGEQQRVSFARLLLYEPSIAFLDEATSALDEENEITLYSILRESGLTFVSVGHRTSLKKFHDYVLYLEGDGGWDLQKAAA